MIGRLRMVVAWFVVSGFLNSAAFAQALGQPDRGAPGDVAIQAYLQRITRQIEDPARPDAAWTDRNWPAQRAKWREEYFHMLGLSPRPAATPLQAQVTGTVEYDGIVVENVHFQSMPKLYVTGNLYRPQTIAAGDRLPTVLYVCGHSSRGRNGGKTAFQSHGIWFAKHGYVCLIVDTLQLGEIPGIHHGTYNKERWWWHNRGYTSAGVECWNGVRAIDYLVSRADVDPERIGVTGISGGGAATFWIAAADERIKVAVPVSGMADLEAYVPNRVANGHCDCMFLYNTFEWPWTRIAALVAPRPLLFMNSDQDAIFPMDANERVSQRLERCYSLFGASDRFETVVSVGGHDYREDLRRARYEFFNRHLKHDGRPVLDGESDLVVGMQHPIAPERLRVYPTDADLPADSLNGTIDETFVPRRKLPVPKDAAESAVARTMLLDELRRYCFRPFPREWTAAQPFGDDHWETEPGITVGMTPPASAALRTGRIVLALTTGDELVLPAGAEKQLRPDDEVYLVQPRGVGPSRWTRRNPPNTIERAHVLLGRTVDGGRVHDLAMLAQLDRFQRPGRELWVLGTERNAVIAATAALFQPRIRGVIALQPPATFDSPTAPQFLNVSRVLDVPQLFGLLADRSLITTGDRGDFATIQAWWKSAGAEARLTHLE